MVRKILALGLLAMSLAAPSASAQTTPAGAAAPAASAVDPASIQALKDMGAFLQTLKRFQVSSCVPVNYGGMVYQQCGNTWYQPQGPQYVVVNPPY